MLKRAAYERQRDQIIGAMTKNTEGPKEQNTSAKKQANNSNKWRYFNQNSLFPSEVQYAI